MADTKADTSGNRNGVADTAPAADGAKAGSTAGAGAGVGDGDVKTVLILYGTETGNSQDLAEDLSRRLRRLHFLPTLNEMDGVQLSSLLKYTLVVFIISTTGQGDMPRNARSFWKSLLRKRLSPTCLDRLKFTAFGLGDSKYPEFNFAVRKLQKRLCQLGAQPFLKLGESDEQHPEGIDATFLPWAQDLREKVLAAYPDHIPPIPDHVLLPPLYSLELSQANMAPTAPSEDLDVTMSGCIPQQNGHTSTGLEGDDLLRAHFLRSDDSTSRVFHKESRVFDPQVDCGNMLKDHPEVYGVTDPFPQVPAPWMVDIPIPDSWVAEVVDNSRETAEDHWQDVRSVTLRLYPKKLPNGKIQVAPIRPGRTIVIFPKNYPQDVENLIHLMGWEQYADEKVSFRSERSDGTGQLMGIPNGVYPRMPSRTLRELLTHSLDITAIPKRSFFEQIWHFSHDETHKERLLEFTDPKLIDEFFDYTSRPRRTMLEVLEEFTSVQIPLEYAATIFPPIRGRHYSISNAAGSPDSRMVEVTLLMALVKYKTVLQKTRQGLCSRYIENLMEDSQMRVQIGGTPWDIPYKSPVIAIATGTGVAPLPLFFQDRASKRHEVGFDGESDLLFYGCRHPKKDYLLNSDDWAGVNVRVRKAFSRYEKPKYVQAVIRENANEVAELLRWQAHIIICGSSGRMPEAVRQALMDVMVKNGLVESEEEARQALKGRLLEETW